MNHDGLNNLSKESTKKHCCHNDTDIGPVVSDKKIFKLFYINFSIQIYRENKPYPLVPMLFDEL